jgi:hypothetical protein
MTIKPGVDLRKVSPQICIACLIANEIYTKLGHDLVITSITDGRHKTDSLHYTGFAADFRTNYFTQDKILSAVVQLQTALGAQFDILHEVDHIHIEFDPK